MQVHLYGVIAADADLPMELQGRAGAPVRAVADDRLAVLVSDVDDDARVGRADLLSHAHVLEAVADAATVIPVQFGMVMPDDETVRREVLDTGADRTAALLDAFDGLVQLMVGGRYDEEAALREVVRRDPALAAARTADDDMQGKMQLGEAVAAGLERLRTEDSNLLVERLAPHARAVAFTETRDAYSLTGVALLVERGARADLDQAVSELGEEVAGRLQLRYVGPQPPYAFLDSVQTEERAWG
ncbi:MAG: GvpL/GvpF family gas vesicle protein [Nocardioides sp.]